MKTVYIDDMSFDQNKGSILVSCSTDEGDVFDLELDAVYMRIDWNGEFEDELQKDIEKAYNDCINEKGKTDIDYIKELVEVNDYQMF